MSDTITMSEQEILDQIQSEVAENRVFLYMKGTPDMPRCGFSNQVVQILNHVGREVIAAALVHDARRRPGERGLDHGRELGQVRHRPPG